jgi:hypothetical protein
MEPAMLFCGGGQTVQVIIEEEKRGWAVRIIVPSEE